jgi:hypothetical protein
MPEGCIFFVQIQKMSGISGGVMVTQSPVISLFSREQQRKYLLTNHATFLYRSGSEIMFFFENTFIS